MQRHVILEVLFINAGTEIPIKNGTGDNVAMRVFSSADLREGTLALTFDPIAKKDFFKFLHNPERFGKKVFIHATADESSDTFTRLHFKSMILYEAFSEIVVHEVSDPTVFFPCN